MRAYIETRAECEGVIRKSGLNATILRPWYILGPGHYWPYVLVPVCKVLEAISISLDQSTAASRAVSSPAVIAGINSTSASRAAIVGSNAGTISFDWLISKTARIVRLPLSTKRRRSRA